MEKRPIKTTIEIYWQNTPPNDKAQDLHMTMNLCGFSRQPLNDVKGPDYWVRDKAGSFQSWKWLESLCKRYKAEQFIIWSEYPN